MKMRYFILFLTFMLVSAASAPGETVLESSLNDQTAVNVTVYNNNLGLIKDIRKVHLPVGEGELRFMDVASHIMPVTVHTKSLNSPGGFTVLEQNYEYDLMNADKLLDKYVGEKIKIIDWNQFQDRKEVIEATLLSNNKGQIYKIDDEIYLGHPGYKILPKIPDNLISKPTLMWLYSNTVKTAHHLEVSYLTKNISWKADYVLVLNQDDTAADMSGWITLDNKSGATYQDAQLKLIAGEVHRVEDRFEDRAYATEAPMKARAPQFEEKEFFEYHIYNLNRKTTIKNLQIKQVNLLESAVKSVEKVLLVRGNRNFFLRQYHDQRPKQPVLVYIKFKNSKENNLGMPLPAGVIRLYKADHDGSLQFIGEDRIAHTPKNEELRLKIGEAFDVVAERIQTDYRRVTTRRHESGWEITLRNHKKKDVNISIEEELYGNWKVLDNSHPYKKLDAFRIRFGVNIPGEGETKVNYRVQIGL